MGKSRIRNRNGDRVQSSAGSTKIPSDPELRRIREERVLPVLTDFQSAEQTKQSAAATSISSLLSDPKCRKLLLREQLVQTILGQTLTNTSLEVRCTGWGLLRDLAREEGMDFCVHLYRLDILTAIGNAGRFIIESTSLIKDPAFSPDLKAQQNVLWILSSSVTKLLSYLSEGPDEIVEAISKSKSIMRFLTIMLTMHSVPNNVDREILSCFLALTEDNGMLSEKLADNKDLMKRLLDIKDSRTSLAVFACGVLHNVYMSMEWFDHNTPVEGASDVALIPALIHVVENSHPSNDHAGVNGTPHSPCPDEHLTIALSILATIATDLQETLEHSDRNKRSYRGSPDIDDDDDQMLGTDVEPSSLEGDADDHEMCIEEMEADMDMVIGDGASDNGVSTEDSTLQLLVKGAAPRILQLVSQRPQESNEAIRHHALSSLNNIAWTVSCIDFTASSGNNPLQKFWIPFAQRIWSQTISPVLASDTADIELASIITSLAWALARSVKGAQYLQKDEHRKFMALYQASRALAPSTSSHVPSTSSKSSTEEPDAFQSLGVKSIGVLAQLALDPAPVALNREIGIFLITVLQSPDIPPADAVEALNQLFDIYADKSFPCDEAVFWADGFYKHLEEVLPKMRKTAKGVDKRKFPDLRARSDEVVINLMRFLKYKKVEKGAGDP